MRSQLFAAESCRDEERSFGVARERVEVGPAGPGQLALRERPAHSEAQRREARQSPRSGARC